MLRPLVFVTAVVVGIATAGPASAQALVPSRQLGADVANGIAMATIEQCRKDGFRVSVAIVDRAGNLQVLVRDAGSGPHTVSTAQRKAFTSATFGISSAEFANRTANPAAAGLKEITGVIALGGALPIRAGNELIGGIGVGGAPGGDKDEACAAAGINKFADQLK